MQKTFYIPDSWDTRIERLRRSALFKKVPTQSSLLRQFVEEGLARMEGQVPPAAGGTAPGVVTTAKGSRR